MDLAIREFTAKIVSEINACNLPIEVKRLILKDIYDKVERTADDVVMRAVQERNEHLNKETNEQGEIE